VRLEVDAHPADDADRLRRRLRRVRDLAGDPLDRDELAGVVVDGDVALLRPDRLAVLPPPADDERVAARRATGDLVEERPVVRMDELQAEVRVGVVLLRRVAVDPCDGGADVLEAARRLQAVAVDDVGRPFRELLQIGFRLALAAVVARTRNRAPPSLAGTFSNGR
jgi:hypothetical protein